MAPVTRSSTKSENLQGQQTAGYSGDEFRDNGIQTAFSAPNGNWQFGQNITSTLHLEDQPNQPDLYSDNQYSNWTPEGINGYANAMNGQQTSFASASFAQSVPFTSALQFAEPDEMLYDEDAAGEGYQPSLDPANWPASGQTDAPATTSAQHETTRLDQSMSLEHHIYDQVSSNTSSSKPRKRAKGKGRTKERVGAFQCREPNCKTICTGRGGFGSYNDLMRHYQDVHHINLEDRTPIQLYFCPWEDGCSRHIKPFARYDNFKAHITKKHNGQLPGSPISEPNARSGNSRLSEPSSAGAVMVQGTSELSDSGEVMEHPRSLTAFEKSSPTLLAYFKITSGFWELGKAKEARLEAIDIRLNQLEQDQTKLQGQISKNAHNIEYLQKLLTKRAGNEVEQQLARKEIAREEQKNPKYAGRLVFATSQLDLHRKSRDDVKQEIVEIEKMWKCYNVQLRKKREAHNRQYEGDRNWHETPVNTPNAAP